MLKLNGHGTHDVVNVCGMSFECVRRGLNAFIRVEVDVVR